MNDVCTVLCERHMCTSVLCHSHQSVYLGFESSARSLMALESALLVLSLLFSTFLPASSKKGLISFSCLLSCTLVAMTVQCSYFKDVWLVRIGGRWVIFFEGKWQSIVLRVPDRPFWVDALELDPTWDVGLVLLCFVYEQDKSLSSCNLYLSMGKQNKTKRSLGSSIVARVKTTEFRLSTP